MNDLPSRVYSVSQPIDTVPSAAPPSSPRSRGEVTGHGADCGPKRTCGAERRHTAQPSVRPDPSQRRWGHLSVAPQSQGENYALLSLFQLTLKPTSTSFKFSHKRVLVLSTVFLNSFGQNLNHNLAKYLDENWA